MGPYPPPLEGPPPYVVWTVGLIFILMALGLVALVVAVALGIYREAQTKRTWAPGWLAAGLLGGWITAVVWLMVKDRLTERGLEGLAAQEPPQKTV